jgi:hypothetical protein
MRLSIAAIGLSLIFCCLAGLYRQVKPDEVESEAHLSAGRE